jgi:dTDP-4-amino-4,6-dideoxygalactose transaminase
MACLLLGLAAEDEVILPSFTYSSCANAIALRGAIPVFVDIRRDTLNLDEQLVANAITSRTRAIMPMHYGGVGCGMDTVSEIAAEYDLAVIEDAAHSLGATFKGMPLGTIGDVGTLSFHITKNVTCGTGGAILINNLDLVERSEIMLDCGTNRRRFLKGDVPGYTWVDVGGSFGGHELAAALLVSQLERAEEITTRRRAIWLKYYAALAPLADEGLFALPNPPAECGHNGHIFHLLFATKDTRDAVRQRLRAEGIEATSHYVPLHCAPAGRRLGRTHGDLTVTEQVAETLLRLPIYFSLEDEAQTRVIESVIRATRN